MKNLYFLKQIKLQKLQITAGAGTDLKDDAMSIFDHRVAMETLTQDLQEQAKEQHSTLSAAFSARYKALWEEREAFRASATLGHEELQKRRVDIEQKESLITVYEQQLKDHTLKWHEQEE